MLALPRVRLLLALLGSLLGNSAALFGEAIDDKVADSRFRNMGQAYISQFEIVDSTTKFQVILEDTLNELEYWVVDFQEYGAAGVTAIDTHTGYIRPENSGECSSVIFSAPYDQENVTTGYYFSDQGNFVNRNVSLLDQQVDGSGANKRLFTSYLRGRNFTEPDSDGNDIQRRDYILSFDDDFGYFFNCTNTNGMNIWQFSNTTDTIEFRTTVYFTNVRPVDPTDGSKGMSWVTSSVDLFYRLNRVAIVNFIVSSVALVKPVLDFVIIDLYYPPATPTVPDTKKASIELQFQTTIESTNGELLALYNSTSFRYLPKNDTASSFINFDLGYDFPNGTQHCQYVGSVRCRQIWNFNFVLELDAVITDDDLPIDATGTFQFMFAKHQCNDPTERPPIDCVELSGDPLTISLEVTIQTVVQVVDSTRDIPTIQLVSLTGTNGEDLRSGGGRRGVNHLEPVSIVVQYFPEFLRSDFDLELTLFMVCKSDLLSSDAGCLSAPLAQRYVAYSNSNFKYTVDTVDDNGDPTSVNYNPESLTQDNKVQQLTTNAYDATNEVYNMGFTNTALSQERLTYTITTVFRLVQKARRRRRRAIAARAQLMLTAGLDGRVVQTAQKGLVEYGLSRSRTRRDIMEAVEDPQGHIYTLTFNGCPANSTFNADEYHCECNRESERYSTESFTCLGPKSDLPIDVIEDFQEPNSDRAPSSGTQTAMSSAMFCAGLTIWLAGYANL